MKIIVVWIQNKWRSWLYRCHHRLKCSCYLLYLVFKHFVNQRSFKTELHSHLSYEDHLSSTQLNLVTDFTVYPPWPRSDINMPNVRKLRLYNSPAMLEQLQEPLFLPKLISIKILQFKFNTKTSVLFERFLEVRGHLLKTLDVRIGEKSPLLVSMLSNAKNLRLVRCEIYFTPKCEQSLTIDHLKALYGVHIHEYLSLCSLSSGHIQNLRDKALKSVVDKKCRILYTI